MKVEEIIDKKEAHKVGILRYLLLNTNVSFDKLMKERNLSKNTLKLYIQEIGVLGEELNKKLIVKREDDFLSLEMSADLNLDIIITHYILDSIEFKILNYLLYHQKFSIIQLTRELSISESSVFRKIKRINFLLEEFGISIKNGRLIGEELQIRYFYFLLYEYLIKNNQSFAINHKKYSQISTQARGLIGALAINISRNADISLQIWLEISRLRQNSKQGRKNNLVKKSRLFQKDKLYKDIYTFMTDYFVSNSEYDFNFESMSIYAFVSALPIMDEDRYYYYDLMRSKRLPTAMHDVYIREYILQHYSSKRISLNLEKQIGYQLSQTNSRLYFFKGYLQKYEWENLIKKETKLLSHNLFKLAKSLQKVVLEQIGIDYDESETSDLQNFLLISYINILSIIDFHIAEIIKIGVVEESLPVYGPNYYQYLFRTLTSAVKGIQVEKYEKRNKYDLVITTDPKITLKEDEKLYLLSEFESNYDLAMIKKIIEERKTEKNILSKP